MYVVLVYDFDEERVQRINKLLKGYLIWVQNSVFEGEITNSLYDEMVKRMAKLMKEEDSVIIYRFKSKNGVERELCGEIRDLNVI